MRIRERFAHNDIISLTGEAVRYDLAESVGPDLALGALLDKGGIESLRKLRSATARPRGTRAAPADRRPPGRAAENVVVMTGSMQALFLAAFILCEPGCDAVVGSPVFPNTETRSWPSAPACGISASTSRTATASMSAGCRRR